MTFDNLFLIALYPLFAFLIIVFGRSLRLLQVRASAAVVIGSTVLSLIHTLVVFAAWSAKHYETVERAMSWLHAGNVNLAIGYLLDGPAMMMLLVVTSVSLLIHIYTHGYMKDDPGYARFYAYLALFNFSMLSLVLSQNLFQMYMFWEMVGVSSYLLIGFWFNKPSAAAAATKAFLMNRVGDFGLLVGILSLLFFSFTWWGPHGHALLSFTGMPAAMTALKATVPAATLTIIGILVFMGPMAKSAQLPLHTWLPDAMEGPTPISALIHAATMVAAGVFLIARMYPLFSATPATLSVIAWVGGATAIVAASIALTQVDIKKALAYSTMSQLGYMVMAMGLGAVSAGLFHLLTHAYFKAMLFLCSGSVIHGCHHEQDMREMGGLRKLMPVTATTYLIGTIAITGVLPFAGFWSKDEIIASAFTGNTALFALALITAGMTSFYMFRTWFMTFTGDYRGHAHPHESPWVMTAPLVILAVPSILLGLALSGMFGFPAIATLLGLAGASGAHGASHAAAHHEPNVLVMAMSVATALVGLGLAYGFYGPKPVFSADVLRQRFSPLYTLFNRKWFFDELYGGLIRGAYLSVATLSSWFDKTVIDGIVNLSAMTVMAGGTTLRVIQQGRIQTYLTVLMIGMAFLVALLMAR
jgi:proton-translocating NADH-quinone oxidoreductase chain L